ncbi:MAG TPA: hypothetical protein VEB63_07535 [Chitinophagaceae bacterium]|nr:hypothetical protein [Chitinophagaceae bacterium]
MKKYAIGALVGATILFIWQGLSWMLLGIHDSAMKYHPAQEQIMQVLSTTTKEDGLYMMPSAATKEEQKEMMKTMEGKPWASVIYHASHETQTARRMIRAFLVDLFLVVALIYILTRGGTPIFRRAVSASVALGLMLFLWSPYMGHIWFDLPWHMIQGDLIDSVVAWGLVGLWLGWWLNRRLSPPAVAG